MQLFGWFVGDRKPAHARKVSSVYLNFDFNLSRVLLSHVEQKLTRLNFDLAISPLVH